MAKVLGITSQMASSVASVVYQSSIFFDAFSKKPGTQEDGLSIVIAIGPFCQNLLARINSSIYLFIYFNALQNYNQHNYIFT